MPFFPPGSLGGGGVKHVARRPVPVREGQIIYVRAPYQDAPIDLQMSTAELGTFQGEDYIGFLGADFAPRTLTAGGSLQGATGNVLGVWNDSIGTQYFVLPSGAQAIANFYRRVGGSFRTFSSIILFRLTEGDIYLATGDGSQGPQFWGGQEVIRLERSDGTFLSRDGEWIDTSDAQYTVGQGYYRSEWNGADVLVWVPLTKFREVGRLPPSTPALDGWEVYLAVAYDEDDGTPRTIGFWKHEGGEWRKDDAGGSGGVPAAVLAQGDDDTLGLTIGLAHENAGPDWGLLKQQRQLYVRPRGTFGPSSQNLLIIYLPDILQEPGQDATNWRVLGRTAASGSVNINEATKRITFNVLAGQAYTLSTLRTGLLGAEFFIRAGHPRAGQVGRLAAEDVVIMGDGAATLTIASGTGRESAAFSTGAAEEEIGANLDEVAKTLALRYDAADTQQAIMDALDEYEVPNGSVHVTEKHGTDLTAVPEAPGSDPSIFDGYYAQASLSTINEQPLSALPRLFAVLAASGDGLNVGERLTTAAQNVRWRTAGADPASDNADQFFTIDGGEGEYIQIERTGPYLLSFDVRGDTPQASSGNNRAKTVLQIRVTTTNGVQRYSRIMETPYTRGGTALATKVFNFTKPVDFQQGDRIFIQLYSTRAGNNDPAMTLTEADMAILFQGGVQGPPGTVGTDDEARRLARAAQGTADQAVTDAAAAQRAADTAQTGVDGNLAILRITDGKADSAISRVRQAEDDIDDEVVDRQAGDRIVVRDVSDHSTYSGYLDFQETAATALVLRVTLQFNSNYRSAAYSWDRGDILYVPPRSVTPVLIATNRPKRVRHDFTTGFSLADNNLGETMRFTGSSSAQVILPAVSNPDATEQDDLIFINDGSAILTLATPGVETIDGEETRALPAGEAITVMLTSASTWKVITDTAVGTGGSSGGTPSAPAAAYIAWSADTAFTAAEFKAGTTVSGARQGAVPTGQSGFAYLGLWLAGNAWDSITSITIDNGNNGLNDMEAAVALSIDGVAGKYRRYTARFSGPAAGGDTMRWLG